MAEYKLLKDLEVGMLIAESIINNYGQLMIPNGSTLSEKHIKLLKTWNIKGAKIKSSEDELVFVIPAFMKKELRDRVLSKFSKLRYSELNTELFNDLIEMGIIYHAKKLKN